MTFPAVGLDATHGALERSPAFAITVTPKGGVYVAGDYANRPHHIRFDGIDFRPATQDEEHKTAP